MPLSSGKTRIANLFGSLGYMSLIGQWTWALIVGFYPLLISERLMNPYQRPGQSQLPAIDFSIPEPVALVIVSIVTTAFIVLSIYLLLTAPRAIGSTAAKTSTVISNKVIAVTHRKKPLPKKERKRLSYRLKLGLKMLLIAIPVVVGIFPHTLTPLSSSVIVAVTVILAGFSILSFVFQYGIAFAARVDTRSLW